MKLSEFQLIEKISQKFETKNSRVICGIGDDCAVIQNHGLLPATTTRRAGYYARNDEKDSYSLLTTDCLIEDVDFTRKKMSARAIGKKAILVNVSDIAAMGGKPLYALITLGIPPKLPEKWILECFRGIQLIADQCAIDIVGGDLTRMPSKHIMLSLTLIGEVKKQNYKLRSGAQVGDVVVVTGPLGLASQAHYQKTPVLRLKEAAFLAGESAVTSMIDISDGLLQDFEHILQASRVGGIIYADQIPRGKKASLTHALSGGEDFELLSTISAKQWPSLKKKAKKNNFSLHPIGQITNAKRGLQVLDKNGCQIRVQKKGFDHFD